LHAILLIGKHIIECHKSVVEGFGN